MTDDVNMYEFLLGQKPVCTQTPIKNTLGRELHRKLRAKYKAELGIDLLADRCDNTFNCKNANSGCIGRPFPKDPDILRALQSINVTITEDTYKGRDVYMAVAQVDCSDCPLRTSCENTCVTQDSYMKRSTQPDLSPSGYMLLPYDDFEKGKFGPVFGDCHEEEYVERDNSWVEESLPLDCLSPQQLEIIEKVVHKGIDQSVVAGELGIDRGLVSRQYDRAVARLEEFGRARKAIRDHGAPERVKMYYNQLMTQQEIADKEGVSREAVKNMLIRWKGKCL